MNLSQKRPVYLDLVRIRLPIAGVVSIIHRLTGVAMVLFIPVLTYLLQLSLSGQAGFARAAALLNSRTGELLLLLLLWALLHHLLAGIRYLLIDIDLGVERPAYRYSAWAVTLTAPPLALLTLVLLP